MDSKLGVPLVIAAVILGLSVLGASLIVRSSLDAGTEELAGVRTALNDFKGVLAQAAQPQPQRAQAPPQRRGPDPDKRHTLNTEGSPAKGPRTAKVTIVEFSDFQ